MKKQPSKKSKPRLQSARRDPYVAAQPRGTTPGLDRLEEALGRAARMAEPYPEEAEAIERVIQFVHGHGDIRLADVLLALSILITALDREPTPEERQMFAWLDALLGVPPRIVPVLPATVPPYAPSVATPQRPRPLVSRYAPASIPPIRLAA